MTDMTIKIQGSTDDIKKLSPHILSALGVNQLAYIKHYTEDDHDVYAVYAADGTRISVFDDREMAEDVIRYNNLKQVTIQ
jgi:hypothetical protein